MNRLVVALIVMAALLTVGCGSEQKDSAQNQTDTAGQTQAGQPAVELTKEEQQLAAGLHANPSGVRWEEMETGTGAEVVEGSYVVFDYNCWVGEKTGVTKGASLGSSVGRPGQAYKCQVGVNPLPGLSDGLIGMKVGGSRRIYVPAKLGFPSGHPMNGRDLIYEAIGIKEITPEETQRFQDSVKNRLELIRQIQDSIQQFRADSLAKAGLDSLGNPLTPAGDKQ